MLIGFSLPDTAISSPAVMTNLSPKAYPERTLVVILRFVSEPSDALQSIGLLPNMRIYLPSALTAKYISSLAGRSYSVSSISDLS